MSRVCARHHWSNRHIEKYALQSQIEEKVVEYIQQSVANAMMIVHRKRLFFVFAGAIA